MYTLQVSNLKIFKDFKDRFIAVLGHTAYGCSIIEKYRLILPYTVHKQIWSFWSFKIHCDILFERRAARYSIRAIT